MRHLAARALTALTLVAASLAWAAPASADVQGFAVDIGQNPATFTIGKQARTLTAVATTEREGRRCVKVRWALTVRTEGVSLDQIRINRVENDQTFRTRTQVDDDAASIVDAQLDPGQLCRDQTVTGRWDIAFTGPDDGEVTLEARALDVAGRQLSSASTTSRVVTAVAAKPSVTPSPSPSPSVSATEEETEQVADDATTPTGRATSAAALNPAAGTPSVLGPGLIIGAVLVFLGVALLLRIRTRNRKADPAWQAQTQALPTGFYSMPRRRR
ncbi:hypothetical protein [Paractinoplanes toevensis]|uniref:Uncharacterized protein n=1 Tax=Paractinoplanes toevensis TaxID=571911 RepID=A0A919T2M8_9ACTN|nr:hypothetical protein [Actinoplanes toevensis]GIM88239.1 hypothetical protein Ato02nite_000320 [Actinoplanes toevensis]